MSQELNPRVFNFGKVSMWNNPPARFEFTNTGSSPVIFLPVPYQRNIQITIPKGYIQPGASAEIAVHYYTDEGGNLNVRQDLFHSGSDHPLKIVLKGRILSIHPDAYTECPKVDKSKADLRLESGLASLTVYDKESGLVINGVDVLLQNNERRLVMENTRKELIDLSGIPMGLYNVKISKPGYKESNQSIYVNRHSGAIAVYIERAPISEESLARSSDKDPNDEFIELEPEGEDDMDAIERLRKWTDEKYKNRRIVERDVLVITETDTSEIKEPEIASSELDPPKPDFTPEPVETSTMDDLDGSGLLNSDKYVSNNLVMLIDVSGSMKIREKLDLLKTSMKQMASVMRSQDMLTIITYSSRSEVVLESCPGDRKDLIYATIDSLTAKGNSFGAEGMLTAYRIAHENFIPGGNNQIILATDGLFNSREISSKDLYDLASEEQGKGVSISVIGFGKKKEPRQFMQTIAERGGGNFIEINSRSQAGSALVTEIMEKALVE